MQTWTQIRRRFERIGARAELRDGERRDFVNIRNPLAVDILADAQGEYYDFVCLTRRLDLRVADTEPHGRHLLLEASNSGGTARLLCGHDELHWFVAALPETSRARSVHEAKEDLKPDAISMIDQRRHDRLRHRRSDYFRQGEWFFIPCRHAGVDPAEVVAGAELARGGGKPHRCEFLYREGQRRFACRQYPRGVLEAEYLRILATRRKSDRWGWRELPYQPTTYVRGLITHPDHEPLFLDIWHRVEMNTELLDMPRAVSTVPRTRSTVRVKWRD